MHRFPICFACLLMLFSIRPLAAQEAVAFGAWRAYCAPVSGCVMGVKSGEGDTLALMAPPSGDGPLLLFLAMPVPAGGQIDLAVDRDLLAVLKSGEGWRGVETTSGPAMEIDSSLVRNDLLEQMRRRAQLTISYELDDGARHRVVFSLNGFADTLGYVDEE